MAKILLMNDAELIPVLQDSFLRRSEFDVLTAETVAEAVERAREAKPDLVLLDGESAVDGCREIRADATLAGTPVLIVGREEDAQQMREAGADGLIFKPVTSQDLIGALRELLSINMRSSERRPARLTIDYCKQEGGGVGHTKDIGDGGLFLRTRESFVAGERIQLIFEIPGESRPTIRADAEVVRIVRSNPDSHLVPGVGVRFRRMSSRDRSELTAFVTRLATTAHG